MFGTQRRYGWATYEGNESRDTTLEEKADPKSVIQPRYWVPEYVLWNAVNRIPTDIEPPTKDEREKLVAFLKRRQGYLESHIFSNTELFPGLTTGS